MKARRAALAGTSAVLVFSVLFVSSSTISSASKPAFNAALHHQVGDYTGTGGVLKLGSQRLCDSFDPAASYDLWCAVVFRTYTRNIVSYAGKAGNDSFILVPDLARSKPKASKDFTKWTIKLRKDIKWDDGTALTSTDVKYTIQRLFDADIVGTVSNETLCLLSECASGTPDYLGPYRQPNKDLVTVQTPDEYTVEITLRAPNARFNSILAIPQFGIVEKARDELMRAQGKKYGNAPASSGPFVLSIGDDAVTFVRNTQWNQETDSIRVPKVDSMEWQTFQTSDQADEAALKHVVDLRIDGGLSGATRTDVFNDVAYRDYLDQSSSGAVNYLALVSSFKPLDNKDCREAIAYALDKSDLSKIQGGVEIAPIAHSMISPGIPGGDKKLDLYPSGKTFEGNVEKAKSKLIKCGYPDGFEVRMAYVNLGLGKTTDESIQKSLSRVGIVVDPIPFESFADYFASGIGSPENIVNNDIGLIATSWIPESGSSPSYWGPIVDGRRIKLRSNLNYAALKSDPINEKIDALENSRADVAKLNQEIDRLVMDQAVYLPYVKDAYILYRGIALTNVYVQHALYGEYDLVNIGRTIPLK